MSEKKVHYAKTESSQQTYQVFFNRELILESSEIVKLNEHYDGKDFPSVIYFPESALSALETTKTAQSTRCLIKGDASYWDYKTAENSIWSYENPTPDMAQIKNHFAFDRKQGFKVTLKN